MQVKAAYFAISLLMALAGCSATLPSGHIVGATYARHQVQVFSMGEGRLPDGEKDRTYLHVRLSARNASSTQSLHIDPRQQILSLPAVVLLRPAFAECGGRAGAATIKPQQALSVDLFYLMPGPVDEAELQWAMSEDTGAEVTAKIKFAALRPAGAALTQGVWVPTAPEGQDYYVSTLRPWAEPTYEWYWWRASDFPAWLRPYSESRTQNGNAYEASAVSIYVGDEQWYFGGGMDTAITYYEPSFDMPARAPRQRSGGWRHAYRPPPVQREVHRAQPSRAEDVEPRSASESPGESREATRTTESSSSLGWRREERSIQRAEPSRTDREETRPARAEPAPSQVDRSPRREPEPSSGASSVGRSWRRGR